MTTSNETSLKSLLGLGAYAAIYAQARLAKDGDQAPRPWEHIDMARMSGTAWETFETIEKTAQKVGLDLVDAIQPYEGILDEIDARLRPTTWWERLTKTYVAMGIFTDAMKELALAVGEAEFAGGIDDFGHGEWARARLEPVVAEDEQLEARLSLWTRRVGGEALSLVRAFLFTNPEILGEDTDTDALMDRLSNAHKQRLSAIHLHP
ncbi:MAG: ferritin-like fold-containing protein [Actinomycetaceae bacterium]|nr:ferritin-like fold-containing protein [Actinomycetaceae bacterium]